MSEEMWIEYCASQDQKLGRAAKADRSVQVRSVYGRPSPMTAEQEQERVPRMSLAETRQYAIKQHAIDEHKYASEVEENFSDAYLGGDFEKPLLRSQMYDMLAAQRRRDQEERAHALAPGPHLDDIDMHPLRPYVCNYPPPGWLQMHPMRPPVGGPFPCGLWGDEAVRFAEFKTRQPEGDKDKPSSRGSTSSASAKRGPPRSGWVSHF